jgi:hypothetical protein
MSRRKLEVADIFRRHGEAWRTANAGHVNLAQHRVMTKHGPVTSMMRLVIEKVQ